MTSIVPKLPKNAPNGQQVCDVNGVIYQFDASTKAWIRKGYIATPGLVSSTSDGLITPDVYERVKQLQEMVDSGLNFTLFKIAPALDSYWYYLTSHNRTVSFSAESPHDLRLEINRSMLTTLLSRYICAGSRGKQGVKGKTGKSGIPGPPELIQRAEVSGLTMPIDFPVISDIDTNISLRIYKDGIGPVIELLVPFNGSGVTVRNNTGLQIIDLPNTSLVHSSETGRITGVISVIEAWPTATWTVRVGQIGKTGPRGVTGKRFFDIRTLNTTDESIMADRALVSLRHGAGTLYYYIDQIIDKHCVEKLNIKADLCSITSTGQLYDLTFLAVKQVAEVCKDTTVFNFSRYLDEPDHLHPDLFNCPTALFPDWTPMEACIRQRHWSSSQFLWTPLTAVPAADVSWPAPDSRKPRDPRYPWGIATPTPPGERCCQDDFFYCANINNEQLPIISPTGGTAVLEPPPVPGLCCDCDCPIELEVQNGFHFNDYVVDSDGNVSSCGDPSNSDQQAVCTLDGGTHLYKQRVIIAPQNGETEVSLKFRVDWDPICDDARNAMLNDKPVNEIPGFTLDCPPPPSKAECPFRFSAEVVQQEGVELLGPAYKEAAAPGTITFKMQGSGVVVVHVQVNITGRSCCLGYRIGTSIGADPEFPPSVSASLSPLSPSMSLSPSGTFSPSLSAFSLSPSPSLSLSPSLSEETSSESPSLSLSFSPSTSFSPSMSQSGLSASLALSTSPNPSLSFSPTFSNIYMVVVGNVSLGYGYVPCYRTPDQAPTDQWIEELAAWSELMSNSEDCAYLKAAYFQHPGAYVTGDPAFLAKAYTQPWPIDSTSTAWTIIRDNSTSPAYTFTTTEAIEAFTLIGPPSSGDYCILVIDSTVNGYDLTTYAAEMASEFPGCIASLAAYDRPTGNNCGSLQWLGKATQIISAQFNSQGCVLSPSPSLAPSASPSPSTGLLLW